MNLSPELIKQLLEIFEIELAEQVEVITTVLLDLEKGIQGEDRQKALDNMFRAAHNIKGAAGGVNVDPVAEISHELETLFMGFKSQKIEPVPETIDLCLKSLDHMNEAMQAYVENKPLIFDLAQLLKQLSNAHGSEAQDKSRKPELVVLAKAEAPAKAQAQAGGRKSTRPTPEQKSINVDIAKISKLAAHTEQLQVSKIHLEDNLGEVRVLNEKIQQISSLWRRKHLLDLKSNPEAEESDRLFRETISCLGELSHISGQVQQTMGTNGKRLGILADSLRDDVRMMRLVPASTLLRPLERIVRDIARELEKEVVFEVIGDEIEIDRKVLEGIRDPIVHLVRNSIDHGIEQPSERRKLGKPKVGQLMLELRNVGGQILLTIEDDGAGICEQKIAQIALRKKLITENELADLDPGEKLELIFRPGFSSKEIITHISGRGVGLDVVRANLRKLKGNVRIDTEVGKFTRFTLTLPLTLATDRGLVVNVSGQEFAIPTTNVDRVLTIAHDELAEVSGGKALLFEGRTIPVIGLAKVLKLAPIEPLVAGQISLVVVSRGWDVTAFEVDEIIGERELVIKPLLPPLTGLPNVSGGTLTGNGEIIIVLNADQILESAALPGMRGSSTEQLANITEVVRPHILVVDDSISVRTLEKSIFEGQGYEVSVAPDGKKAWEVVQKNDFDLVVTDYRNAPHGWFRTNSQG